MLAAKAPPPVGIFVYICVISLGLPPFRTFEHRHKSVDQRLTTENFVFTGLRVKGSDAPTLGGFYSYRQNVFLHVGLSQVF